MVSLTHVVITMRGQIFQPCALIAFINGLYSSSFVCLAWTKNLSCIKVNSMIWMVRTSACMNVPFCSYATPCM